MRPELSTTGRSHSSLKFWANPVASSAEPAVTITFSSRVHESLVQFVEPVSTAAPGVVASRTTYL